MTMKTTERDLEQSFVQHCSEHNKSVIFRTNPAIVFGRQLTLPIGIADVILLRSGTIHVVEIKKDFANADSLNQVFSYSHQLSQWYSQEIGHPLNKDYSLLPVICAPRWNGAVEKAFQNGYIGIIRVIQNNDAVFIFDWKYNPPQLLEQAMAPDLTHLIYLLRQIGAKRR